MIKCKKDNVEMYVLNYFSLDQSGELIKLAMHCRVTSSIATHLHHVISLLRKAAPLTLVSVPVCNFQFLVGVVHTGSNWLRRGFHTSIIPGSFNMVNVCNVGAITCGKDDSLGNTLGVH